VSDVGSRRWDVGAERASLPTGRTTVAAAAEGEDGKLEHRRICEGNDDPGHAAVAISGDGNVNL